jgi:hypothetical protein
MIYPQLPGPTELGPLLKKLEGNPGSIVLVASEQPGACNYATCTTAWLTKEERKTLKAALERFRKCRQKSHDVARSDIAATVASDDSGR